MQIGKSRESTEIPDNIEFLASTSNRYRVLEALTEDKRAPTELREKLDIPRSTFRRILSELQERGWVDKKGTGYFATPLGVFVADYFSDCIETMDKVDMLSEFFDHVPFSEIDVGFDEMLAADVTVSEPYAPYAPMERFVDVLEGADEVRSISPVVTDIYAEAYYDTIIENETRAENVVREEVARVMTTRHSDRMTEATDSGRTETYVYSGSFPLGLSIIDGTVLLGAFDDEGIMRALVETDSREVLEWARDYHGRYVEAADPIEAYA